MSEPFITGSRAYGTPRPDSDVDLVCVLTEEQIAALSQVFDVKRISETRYIVRCGAMNLIICLDESDFVRWRDVTESLRARGPVTREDAIEAFHEAGLTGYADKQ